MPYGKLDVLNRDINVSISLIMYNMYLDSQGYSSRLNSLFYIHDLLSLQAVHVRSKGLACWHRVTLFSRPSY